MGMREQVSNSSNALMAFTRVEIESAITGKTSDLARE